MTTIRFSDLTEEKKEEFLRAIKTQSNLIYTDYRQLDSRRHLKIIGWIYKIKANRMFHEWQDFEKYITDIQVNQDKIIAYGIW